MALFLPALVACRDWRMQTRIVRKGRMLYFQLTSDDGLSSQLPPAAAFDSSVEAAFAFDWGEGARDGWRLERETEILHVGQRIFLPDFVLRHTDGRRVLLEIIGYWTPEYLSAKQETLRRFAHHRTLLAVAERQRDKLTESPHDLIVFKTRLSADQVLARLRKLPGFV
jgi:predicted nuclease of restriction endonuclease-like RecB superfamily